MKSEEEKEAARLAKLEAERRWRIDVSTIKKLTKEGAKAAINLTREEVRFVVNAYYMIQENRKRAGNQGLALSKQQKPNQVIAWIFNEMENLEDSIKSAMDTYSGSNPLGIWAREQDGIGPIIAAGLLAHIDLVKATSAGKIWRFAGYDPKVIWLDSDGAEKWLKDRKINADTIAEAAQYFGRCAATLERDATTNWKDHTTIPMTRKSLANAIARRPWNADLKVLCWKIGKSFSMVDIEAKPTAIYARLYRQRKAYEIANNEKGLYAPAAAAGLARKKDNTQTAWYKKGMLPPGQLDARARRWAVKLFLSHYHEVGRKMMGLPVNPPYPIAHLGHTDYIEPPRGPQAISAE